MSPLQVSDLRIERSPRSAAAIRLSVQVAYPGSFSHPERLWFDVPERFSDEIDPSGNPWLPVLLPLAVTHHWPISMALPVDLQLRANAQALMQIWHSWYPELVPVSVETESQTQAGLTQPSRTGLFFSGGVDSCYTLLRSQETREEAIDDLIMIHGFDIAVDNDRAFGRMARLAQQVAESIGKSLVPVATNARLTRFREADWGGLAFGPLLAGAGLVLGNRYRRVLISAGLFPGRAFPHGSHPDTDHLYSTGKTQFIHFGHRLGRFEKLDFLRGYPEVLNQLRVCFGTRNGENCGRCRKCLAVMTFLEIHGELATSTAFPDCRLDLRRLRHVYLSGGVNQYRELQAYALQHGRADIADAIGQAFKRTDRLDTWLGLKWVRAARQRSLSHPSLRRATQWVRPMIWRMGLAINRRLPW